MRRLLTVFGAMTLTGALALAFLPGSGLAPENWIADFDKAVEVAKREKKDLLVDFTGSDWCGWCKRLDKEVFSQEPFLDAAKSQYVLVKLDFPRSDEAKAEVPNPERNAELRDRYGVRGYPTVLLMTPEGQVFGQTGYREGGPEKYVEHLQEERQRGTQELQRLQGLVDELKQAEGEQHGAALDKVIGELEAQAESGSPFTQMLARALEQELREAEAAEQRQRILRALLEAGQVDAQLMSMAREIDPRNEQKLFETAVFALMGSVSSEEQIASTLEQMEALLQTQNVDEEKELQLRITAADWNHRFIKNQAAARAHAERALALAPEDNEGMRDFLKNIIEAE